MKFEFIAKHRGVWRTSLMCEVLGVSRAGLHDWMRRPAGPRHATAPSQRWVADFTYIWTDEGRLQGAALMDLFSRRIAGWSMSSQMTAQLVTHAVLMALWRRGKPQELLHHSDQASRRSRRDSNVASQRIRKRVEEGHGWGKDGRPMRKMKALGLAKAAFLAMMTVSCYTLLRVAKFLNPAPALRSLAYAASTTTQDLRSMSRPAEELEHALVASDAPAIAAATVNAPVDKPMALSTAC